MKNFTRYHKLTGQVICIGSCSDDQIEYQETDDFGFVEGHFEGCYIDNGNIIPIPKSPSEDHDWDAIKKKWSLNQQRKDEKDAAKVAAEARQAAIDQHEAEHAFIRELMKKGVK